jgi:hypothetical protein
MGRRSRELFRVVTRCAIGILTLILFSPQD